VRRRGLKGQIKQRRYLLNEELNFNFNDDEFRRQTLAALGLAGLETMDAETLVNTPLASTPFVVS